MRTSNPDSAWLAFAMTLAFLGGAALFALTFSWLFRTLNGFGWTMALLALATFTFWLFAGGSVWVVRKLFYKGL